MSDDPLAKLNDALLSRLESQQWRERGETLDIISKHLSGPILQAGNYNGVVRGLLHVLGNDKHNALVVRAANVIEQLVHGLGANFAPYAERTLVACLAKCKGTNQHIVQAIRSASRAVLETIPFDAAIQPILAATSNPATGIQVEATNLLAHCLFLHNPLGSNGAQLTGAQRMRAVKPLLPTLAELFQHRTPECREASCQALAAARLFLNLSSQDFASVTDGLLDDQRRLKVDVAYDMLRQSAEASRAKRGRTTDESSESNRSKKRDKERSRSKRSRSDRMPIERTDDPPSSVTPSTKVRRPLREKQDSVELLPPSSATKKPSGKSKSTDKRGRQQVATTTVEIPCWADLCSRLSDYLSDIVPEELKSAEWKIRLRTAQSLKTRIITEPPTGQTAKWLIYFAIQSERLKDINFQVRGTMLEIILALIPTSIKVQSLDNQFVGLLCQHIVPSLTDVKCAAHVREILNRLASGATFASQLFAVCQGTMKPPLFAAILEWLAENVLELRLKFELTDAVSVLRSAFASSNASVRTAAIRLAGRIHLCPHSEGRLRSLLADEKPALLARLDEELARTKAEMRRGPSQNQNISNSPNSSRKSSISSASSSSSGSVSSQPRRGDITISKVSAPMVDHLLEEESGSDGDNDLEEDDWNQTTPIKGVINVIQPVTPSPINNELFFVQSGQTSELMSRKQSRLLNLNKNLCIDLMTLRRLFVEANANPALLKSLFTSDVESRLEALDKLIACLDTTSAGTQSDPPAITLTYAFFDLLLAWTVGTCFTFWFGSQTDSGCTQSKLPTRTEARALVAGGLQYLTVVISRFAQAQFLLSDQEVELMLHVLLSDQAPSLRSGLVGQTMEASVRNAVVDLIRLLRQVYPAIALRNRIADLMHRCGSASVRQSCLQELISLLPRFGDARGLNLEFTLKLVAQQIADPEAGVRQAALEFLRLAHRLLGVEIWDAIGPLHHSDLQTLKTHLAIDPPDSYTVMDSMTAGYTTPLVRNHPPVATDVHRSDRDGTQLSCLSHSRLNFDGTGLSTSVKASSRRAASPPPVHSSPAALNVLIPLVNLRNCTTATEALRLAAAEQLNEALTCLVNQLDVSPFRTGEVAEADQTVSNNETTGLEESREDESDVLNNVLLGALVDLETLVLDSRTRELLVPFFNAIVDRLASLALCLANTECSAGHTLFTNCLAGILIVLFEQPFLARQVSVHSFECLLANLLQLAQHGRPADNPRLQSNTRRLNVLRLVCFLQTSVEPTLAFHALLQLLYTCSLGFQSKGNASKPGHRRRRSARLSSTSQDSIQVNQTVEVPLSPATGLLIWPLVVAQLAYRTRSLNLCADRTDWSVLLPLLDRLLSLFNETPDGDRNRDERRRERRMKTTHLPSEIEASVRRLIVDAYALLGPQLITHAEKATKERSLLTTYLRHLAQLMPNAPYQHCLQRNAEE